MSTGNIQHIHPSYYHCKGQHTAVECKFATALCHNCGKRGHIKKACRNKARTSTAQKAMHKSEKGESRGSGKVRRTHLLRGEGESDTEDNTINTVYRLSQEIPKVAPITRTVTISGMKVISEIDTACGVTILSKQLHTIIKNVHGRKAQSAGHGAGAEQKIKKTLPVVVA